MDFGMLFKLQGLFMKFSKNHPKVVGFINSIRTNGIKTDMIIDMKITYPDGKEFSTNMKVSDADLQLLDEIKKMKK